MISAAATAQAAPQQAVDLGDKTPAERARAFVAARYFDANLKLPTLAFWRGAFWSWDGKRWQPMESIGLRKEMLDFLEGSMKMEGARLVPLQPKTSEVDSAFKELRYVRYLPSYYEQPSWIGNNCPFSDLKDVWECQNGLLDTRTRTLHPHTPQFWSSHVVDYTYDPNATAPRTKEFLDETWSVDDEAQWLALELIGISGTKNTRFQKFWQIVGRPGTGKGT